MDKALTLTAPFTTKNPLFSYTAHYMYRVYCIHMLITIPVVKKNIDILERLESISAAHCELYRQALDNSLEPSILSETNSGKIILVNAAACNLLGYSKKELLTRSRSEILNVNEISFKNVLTNEGRFMGAGIISAIKKCGSIVPCEISSAAFIGEHGIKKTITTIHDMRYGLMVQKYIDSKKEKIVADNIILAKTKQGRIDIAKDKIVKEDIILAKTRSDNRLIQQKIEFGFIASHELKTPITCIKAYTQLLQMDLVAAGNMEAAATLTMIEEQIDKLTGVVNNLLASATMHDGKLQHIVP